MSDKPGRNDPCPCGSGKKYKSCCWASKGVKKKLTAKWINAPQGPNLLERTFGNAIQETSKNFTPAPSETKPSENISE